MKTFKITLISLFSIGLLTAVLPASETEPTLESTNHEASKPNIDLTVMIDLTRKKVRPQNG